MNIWPFSVPTTIRDLSVELIEYERILAGTIRRRNDEQTGERPSQAQTTPQFKETPSPSHSVNRRAGDALPEAVREGGGPHLLSKSLRCCRGPRLALRTSHWYMFDWTHRRTMFRSTRLLRDRWCEARAGACHGAAMAGSRGADGGRLRRRWRLVTGEGSVADLTIAGGMGWIPPEQRSRPASSRARGPIALCPRRAWSSEGLCRSRQEKPLA